MLFTDIRLQNYRSYTESSFELGKGVNIVIGPNAAGKTNLLEALMVAAVGYSFRSKDGFLIKNGEQWARIDVHTDENVTRVIKLQKQADKTVKTFEFDEKPYKRLTVENKQPVVLFQPDDLRLLFAEPQLRRDYIDNLLEQYTPGYATLRVQMRRALAQRNALLKSANPSSSQIFAWNIRFCEIATKMVQLRVELVSAINEEIATIYTAVSGKQKPLSIHYETKTPIENYSNALMAQLEQNLELDRLRGFTGRGPHRDDVVIYDGDQLFSTTASRGENRTCMLALKIFELGLLEAKSSKRPLLLLDDVFSELDGSRRRALTDFLSNHQTLITTTDADIVTQNFSSESSKILLTNN